MRNWLSATALLLLLPCVVNGCSSDDPAATPSVDAAPAPDPDAAIEGDAGKDGDGSSDDSLVGKRPYGKKIPAKYDANAKTPLVVLLHGYGATGKVQDDYFKMSALADAETFLLALPDGTTDSTGKRYWSATDACCDFLGQEIDDIGYLTAVIQDMKSKYNVDPKRVYLIGHSNGGFMANALACAKAGEVAAIVSLAGANYADATKCTPSEQVAVLQVHGDKDGTVNYSGGSLFNGGIAFPGAKQTIATWAAKNGCDATLTQANETRDVDVGIAGEETTVARHACTKGAAELWTITGGAHIPQLQPTWAKSIYDFLKAHPKP